MAELDAQPQPQAPAGPTPLVRLASLAGGRGGALLILVLLVAIFSLLSPNFLTDRNLLNILRQVAVVGVLAVAQTLVIVTAGIDLSVAATAALSGCLMAVSYAHWGWPEPIAWLLGLGSGLLVGAINGAVIRYLRVPDIIATLGAFSAVRGVALLVTEGLPVPTFAKVVEGRTLPESVNTVGAGTIGPFPLIAIVSGLVAVGGAFILARTKLGRAALAVGGNREAAHASGIDVGRTKFRIYALSGLLAALGGMLLAGRLSSANALMGEGMELQSIAAVVVGGTNLFGGQGTIVGTMIGVLIIGVLANGLSIMGIPEFWQRLSNGLIIVAVVALDQWRRRLTGERSR
ncbi:MAG TPA: ABC transporter permease [Candidatus Limnocylindrales bacterium]|nr:ABC transporter permease [Candidatus Limnocylindrales bacterium]